MSIFGTSKPFICAITSTLSISNAIYSNGYVTIETSVAHGLLAGQSVYISNVSGMTDINGIFEIDSCPSTTQIKIIKITAQSYSSGGAIYKGYWFKNSIIEYNFIEPDQLNKKSIINGNKSNTYLGDYGSFKITERLWEKTTKRVAGLKFQEIYSYYHTDVWFFPHANHYIMEVSTSDPVSCYFKTFKPFYYKNLISYDALTCEFETNKYHDITKLIT